MDLAVFCKTYFLVSKSKCERLEYYNDCGSRCTRICFRPVSVDCDQCASGCFCKVPLVRAAPDGPCRKTCPDHVIRNVSTLEATLCVLKTLRYCNRTSITRFFRLLELTSTYINYHVLIGSSYHGSTVSTIF